MGIPPKSIYHPPQTRSTTNGGNLKQNIYCPTYESLHCSNSKLKGKIAVSIPEIRATIFVNPGDDIEKAKAIYRETLILKPLRKGGKVR